MFSQFKLCESSKIIPETKLLNISLGKRLLTIGTAKKKIASYYRLLFKFSGRQGKRNDRNAGI